MNIQQFAEVLELATDLEANGDYKTSYEYLVSLKKDIENTLKERIQEVEAQPIELQLAERVHSHYQYRAPNKAQYIALHGAKAFEANATEVSYSKLEWK